MYTVRRRQNANHSNSRSAVEGHTSACRSNEVRGSVGPWVRASVGTARGSLHVKHPHPRRGVALMLVMLAIGTALVLTYAFTRTQTTALAISQNGTRRQLALQAAQTGAAVALERIESPEWQGVSTPLSRETLADSSGTASYTVTFRPLAAGDLGILPEEAALYLVIQSTGVWQSAVDANNRAQRTVEVVVRLTPRVPGRTVRPGDSADASDRAANIGDYDQIQNYALFADRGATSLVLDPGDRIDGDLWLYENLRLYEDPYWSGGVRREVLKSIGERYASGTGPRHPHPLNGGIEFYWTPSNLLQNDLARLNVSWSNASSRLTLPSVSFPGWQRYRLYEGGFEYGAVEVGSWLGGATLGPSTENPLGVFYRDGSLTLSDDVTIRGTLVCTGTVSVVGDRVHLGSFNWRDNQGGEIVSEAAIWPRLPAIVARNVWIDRSARLTVDAAVIATRKFSGAGGDFEYVATSEMAIDGTATSRPLGQPFSEVQLEGSPDISGLTVDGRYSIWLDDGTTGGWHEIVGVETAEHPAGGARRLTVVGEVKHSSPTSYRIRRTRRRYADIRGPIACERADINRQPAWTEPLTFQWSDLREKWKEENKDREDDGLEPIPFVDWLADPAHWSGWSYPLRDYGLRLEPTFHLRNTKEIAYQWSPPLFRAFEGTGYEEPLSGYRWKVVSWRVVQ